MTPECTGWSRWCTDVGESHDETFKCSYPFGCFMAFVLLLLTLIPRLFNCST